MTLTINHNTAVKAGSALLDEKWPGWYMDVDLDSLRMVSCDVCVLGQCFGEYIKGITILGLGEEDMGPSRHGFDCDFGEEALLSGAAQFVILDKLWTQEIKRRLRADARAAAKQLVGGVTTDIRRIDRVIDTVQRCTQVYRKGETVQVSQVGNVVVLHLMNFPNAPEKGQVIDCHFVLVGFTEAVAEFKSDPARFTKMIEDAEAGQFANVTIDRLRQGPSYIELGGWLGDQTLAFQFMALVEFLGLGKVITPKTLHQEGEDADRAAGMGYIMCLWTAE